MSRRDDGYCLIRYRDGSSISFASHERERVLTAWREGQRYFEGVDECGGTVTCELDDVRAVMHFPPAAIAASRAEDKLDAIEGVGQ